MKTIRREVDARMGRLADFKGKMSLLTSAEIHRSHRNTHDGDQYSLSRLRKELTNMLNTILGARLSWHFANGWVFEPAIVGPDIVDYTLKEGPHAGRHAIQHFYYQRVAPGV